MLKKFITLRFQESYMIPNVNKNMAYENASKLSTTCPFVT